MEYFVNRDSIVRKIWGQADIILFIFGGSAAEFALNKAVDWLYFTGKLPADPLGRLFSTVDYARKIVFAEKTRAIGAIDNIVSIHSEVEHNRGSRIPDWAYRDVLFMLIHYSIASYELLERKLTGDEKEETYNVFYRLGLRMGLIDLPSTYKEWIPVRDQHLNNDLLKSEYSIDLYKQYKLHLGSVRYRILLEGQKLIVPLRVKQLLNLEKPSLLRPFVGLYKLTRKIKLNRLLIRLLAPVAYRNEISELNAE